MAKQETKTTTQTAVAKAAPITHTSAGLRAALFEEMDRVRNGETTAVNANAMARLSGQIISSVHLELEAQKLRLRSPDSGGNGSGSVPKPLLLGAE